jgi:dipeptidase D
MVAVKRENSVHNFETDPLLPRIVQSPDTKYSKFVLQATDTSLGGDDGIGVAIIFAILADKNLHHGPLEALITTDEETGMKGAINLKPGNDVIIYYFFCWF